jgi:sodium-coupled neutral amino acid transporter 11
MPFVFRAWGLALGTLLILLAGYACDLSVKLLCKAARRTSMYSCESLAGFFFGARGDALVLLWLALTTFGMCVAQVIVVADSLVPLAVHWNGGVASFASSPWLVTTAVTAVVILPTCLRHRLRHLAYVSAASLAMVVGFLIAVVIRFAQRVGYNVGAEWPYAHGEDRSLATLSVLSLSFAVHYNVFPLFQELKRPTMHRVKHAVRSSVVFACGAYIIVGFFGYLTFARHTRANVIENYRADDAILAVIRVMLAGSAALSFPLMHHPCRLYTDLFLDRVLWHGKCKMRQADRFVLHTLALLAVTVATGLLARSLFTVSIIVGTFFALPLCFMFPPVIYLMTQRNGGWKRKLLFPLGLLVFAVLIFVLSVAGIIVYAYRGDGHEG